MEKQPTKLVRGRGLAQLLAEGNEEVLNLKEDPLLMVSIDAEGIAQCDWYADIVYYLTNLSCPAHLPDHKKRSLKLKASKYCLVDLASRSVYGLGWKNLDGVILACVEPTRAEELMKNSTKDYVAVTMRLPLQLIRF